jgi:hypothetical protein
MDHDVLIRRGRRLATLVLVGLLATVIGTVVCRATAGPPLAASPATFLRVAPAPQLIGGERRRPTQGPAALVGAYVQHVLAPRVLQVEGALATANRQVLIYCLPLEMVLVRCTDLSSHLGSGVLAGQLTAQLAAQALVLNGASHSFDMLLPPDVGPLPTLQLRCVAEDLALFSDQLSGLLQESVAALSSTTLQQATYVQPAPRVTYGPRMRSVLTILRRAEAWLEAVDRATGARATLPGFGLGSPSVESELALQ